MFGGIGDPAQHPGKYQLVQWVYRIPVHEPRKAHGIEDSCLPDEGAAILYQKAYWRLLRMKSPRLEGSKKKVGENPVSCNLVWV